MVRTWFGRNTRSLGFVFAALVSASFLSSSVCSAAQAQASQAPTRNQLPASGNTASPQSNTTPQQGNQGAAPRDQAPPPSNAALRPIAGILQPSLDTVHQTLGALRLDKWKKGTVRDEASVNIDAIQRDLRVNMPPLLQDADTAPGTLSVLLPVSRHLNALYDVLLRVSEASRVAGPDDQAGQLQQALLSLGNARLALDDRMLGSAGALEKQVVDLRATIQQQAAERAAVPAPVALPCVPPPPAHKVVKKRKPVATPPAATTPGTTPPKPAGSH